MANGATEELLLRIVGDSQSGEDAIKRVQKAWADLGRTLKTAKAEIAFAAGKVNGAAAAAQQAAPKIENLAKKSDLLKQKLNQVGQAGRLLGTIFGGLAAAGGKLIESTSRVAMRNEVLAVALYTVGDNAGYSREELDLLTDQVKDLGITTSEARLGLTRMMQGELDLAKATELARTAQNLAGIAGENSSQAYGNMLEAIVSLQPRMLRQYGIVTTLHQALGDLANSTDASAKRAAFLDYVLNEGAKSAGVYEATMGVVGKQITSLPRYIEELKASFGKHFLPIIGLGVTFLSKLLKVFEALPDGVQRALAMIVLLGTALSALLAGGAGIMVVLPFIVSGFSALSALLPTLLPILAAVGTVIGTLVGAIALLAIAWKENWGGIRDAIEQAWSTIQPYLSQFIALARAWGSEITAQVMAIWNIIKGYLIPIFASIGRVISSIDWGSHFGTLMDALNVVGGYIKAWLKMLAGLLRGEGFKAFENLREAALNAMTLIALVFNKYIRKAAVWGWNLIVQFANGLMRAAQTVLTRVMTAIGNAIGRFIKPGSPPKEGPLKSIVKWGTGLMNTFLKAFGLADFGMLKDMLSPIKSALEDAVSAGDMERPEMLEMFKGVREQVAGLLAELRETGEVSEEALGKIAETLGPGSEELVEYLRLQAQYQRSLNKLADVQAEVAAAEAKGFVPADLKAKLKAAEEEAGLLKDKADWQKEYLDAQQESIDLQLRLVEALESLAEGGLGGGGGGEVGGGGGEEGMGDIGDLGGGLDFGDLGGGLDDIEITLGEMTPEFAAMRAEVDRWYAAFQAWLTLPLDAKLAGLAAKLTEITGINFAGFWTDVQAAWASIEQSGLIATVWAVFKSAWDNVYSQSLARLAGIWGGLLALAQAKIAEWTEPVTTALSTVWSTVWASTQALILEKLRELFAAMGLDFDEMYATWAQIWEDAKTVGAELWGLIRDEISGLVEELRDLIEPIWTQIKDKAAEIWGYVYDAIMEKAEEIYESVIDKINDLKDWFDEQVQNWKDAGKELMEGLKQGILEKAGEIITAVTEAVRNALDAAQDYLGSHSPSRRANQQLGRPIPLGVAQGVTEKMGAIQNALNSALGSAMGGINLDGLSVEMGRAQVALAGARARGNTKIEQNISGDWTFPNVRDGRDAGSIRDYLERIALQSKMSRGTGG